MRRIVGMLLLLAGMGIVTFAVIQYVEHQANLKEAMAEASELIRQSESIDASNGQFCGSCILS
jgi:sortase A